MLSSQTKDPVTASTMRNLQSHFNSQSRPFDVDAVLSISERELDGLISKVGFHNRKAGYIKEAAERLKREYDGDVPCDLEVVLSLKGVGPKVCLGFRLFFVPVFSNTNNLTSVHVLARADGPPLSPIRLLPLPRNRRRHPRPPHLPPTQLDIPPKHHTGTHPPRA